MGFSMKRLHLLVHHAEQKPPCLACSNKLFEAFLTMHGCRKKRMPKKVDSRKNGCRKKWLPLELSERKELRKCNVNALSCSTEYESDRWSHRKRLRLDDKNLLVFNLLYIVLYWVQYYSPGYSFQVLGGAKLSNLFLVRTHRFSYSLDALYL